MAQSASKTAGELPGDAPVLHDDADLAALVELHLAQALTADERRGAVGDDRPHVEPHVGQRPGGQARHGLGDLADDADFDAGLGALAEQPQHQLVGDPLVVDQQLLAGGADELSTAARARCRG